MWSITAYQTCPFCHHDGDPILHASMSGKMVDGNGVGEILVAWRCPTHDCRHIVITRYVRNGPGIQAVPRPIFAAEFAGFLNGDPQLPKWPNLINELKNGNPDTAGDVEASLFNEIYRQSLVAESSGITQLAGIGYRRAFEFFVKDFAIFKSPGDLEKFKNMALVSVIKNYFSPEYQPLMERAAWLGNDETHYERKHPEYDITDLKRIINYIIDDLNAKNEREALIRELQPK
ncbi:MAG: hypothetical protein ABIY90_01640 [Puia sp.]